MNIENWLQERNEKKNNQQNHHQSDIGYTKMRETKPLNSKTKAHGQSYTRS